MKTANIVHFLFFMIRVYHGVSLSPLSKTQCRAFSVSHWSDPIILEISQDTENLNSILLNLPENPAKNIETRKSESSNLVASLPPSLHVPSLLSWLGQ